MFLIHSDISYYKSSPGDCKEIEKQIKRLHKTYNRNIFGRQRGDAEWMYLVNTWSMADKDDHYSLSSTKFLYFLEEVIDGYSINIVAYAVIHRDKKHSYSEVMTNLEIFSAWIKK